MSRTQNKREHLFDKFTTQLIILSSLGFNISFKPATYYCPICTSGFNKNDIDSKNLTLEHVPQKSLGGKPILLTCNKCNNKFGTSSDTHLYHRMTEIEDKMFIPGTIKSFKVRFGNEIFNAEGKYGEGGRINVTHSEKHNDPVSLRRAMENISVGQTGHIIFNDHNLSKHQIITALLKNGFLLAFARFGYNLFLLGSSYDLIWDQFRYPESAIYHSKCVKSFNGYRTPDGVYIVLNRGCESILSIFSIKYDKVHERIGIFLPLPSTDLIEAIGKMELIVRNGRGLLVWPHSEESNLGDFLFNKEDIILFHEIIIHMLILNDKL